MGRIKLGISLKSLGLPFRRSLPEAQKLGVAATELEAMGELWPQNLTQTGRREILHLLRSHDLAVSALVCPLRRGLDAAEDLEPRMEQIRLTMALAFELGPRLVIIQAGRVPSSPPPGGAGPSSSPLLPPGEGSGVRAPDDPRAALMQESLDALGRHGDRTGVTIALDSGLDSPESLVTYLSCFDVGSLAVNFNPANLVIAGHSPYDAVRTFHKRSASVHAQDARRISPNRMATVPLGHGDLDWMQLLANFEEIEYRGPLTVLGNDRAELAQGVAFLRRFVV
jgi:sugar phosphate isomerase/epimerase